MSPLAAQLHELLPQTQCQRCGYPDCASYAQAIASADAQIDQCPPGGDEGVARLAAVTGQTARAINPAFGRSQERSVAFIDEDWCIGCTLCIKACPVDAIIGASKQMHTVIEAHCTGCELCVPACPVDCIELDIATPGRSGWMAWTQSQADQARARYEHRLIRRQADLNKRPQGLEKTRSDTLDALRNDPQSVSRVTDPAQLEQKRRTVAAAQAKARDQLSGAKA